MKIHFLHFSLVLSILLLLLVKWNTKLELRVSGTKPVSLLPRILRKSYFQGSSYREPFIEQPSHQLFDDLKSYFTKITESIEINCTRSTMLGVDWPICLFNKYRLKNPCVIYIFSYTRENESLINSWEQNCSVRIFNPRTNFLNGECIGSTCYFKESLISTQALERKAELTTLKQLRKRFDENMLPIDILKLNLQGGEFEVIDEMVASNSLVDVKQLILHTHLAVFRNRSSNFEDYKIHLKMLYQLRRAGFYRWHIRITRENISSDTANYSNEDRGRQDRTYTVVSTDTDPIVKNNSLQNVKDASAKYLNNIGQIGSLKNLEKRNVFITKKQNSRNNDRRKREIKNDDKLKYNSDVHPFIYQKFSDHNDNSLTENTDFKANSDKQVNNIGNFEDYNDVDGQNNSRLSFVDYEQLEQSVTLSNVSDKTNSNKVTVYKMVFINVRFVFKRVLRNLM